MFTEAAYSIRRKQRQKVRRVLVTGAAGSIGQTVIPLLHGKADTMTFATDLTGATHEIDVTDAVQVQHMVTTIRPTHILHLAGAKHAPEGETDPAATYRVNTVGTDNILTSAGRAKVILASTCKACDPETAYGASKLIAERMVLNAKGVVVRYYNVRETSGNVFRLWEQVPEGEPLLVTDCWRYFISAAAAAHLTLAALDLPTGRYITYPGRSQHMPTVAAHTYPGRATVTIPRRRGDREREPYIAKSETTARVPGTPFLRVTSPHDP